MSWGNTVRADWSRSQALYRQCLEAIDADGPEPYLPSQLPSFLAELLSRVSVSYFDSYGDLVRDAASELDPALPLADLYVDPRFQMLPEYQHGGTGRRRPTPFEAIVETSRRLRDMLAVEKALAPLTVGGVVGGSASYGRFLNVQGAVTGNASDIDFFVVVSDVVKIADLLGALRGIPGVSEATVERAVARYDEYIDLTRSEESADIVFSCKIALWSDDEADPILDEVPVDSVYYLSFHILPEPAARRVLMLDVSRIDRTECGSESSLRDFRETPAARADHQRSFSGRNVRIELHSEEYRSSHVRETRIFVIDEKDYYFPGMFQNLILPAFDAKWGSPEFKRGIESLRWKLVERLRYERHVHQDDMLRMSLSHTRSLVFAPHVVRAVDASTHLS